MTTTLFSSRWGMMLAMLGMAVGTGNIWRFPRIAASNGGGSFLVAWVVFLLLWSIPLILVEFAMGKSTRYGTVGAFAKIMGPRAGWMGAFVAWTATAIMFYYAVVMSWTLRYFWGAVTGELPAPEPGALWESFAGTANVLPFHALSLGLALLVVWRGVRGIEAAARILIPSLFVLVLVLAIRAVTLPGAERGLAFLFTPSLEGLANYRVWLEALTQNAWDTGAGWGLILTYAVYLRKREDTALNAFMLGFGNNSVSLLAGIMVLCTVFSIMPDAASAIVGAGNEGLTFIWVPQLFAAMPFGRFFMALFFLALVFAAWTSLISMIELATRVLQDGGMARSRAIALIGGFGFLAGVPSALSMNVFGNQDFVWGVGLMVSGLFFALAAIRYGVTRFRETLINADADIRIGRWWDWAIRLVVIEAAVLIIWWFIQVRTEALFGVYGIGNVLLQWAIVLAFFILANRWMVDRTLAGERRGPPPGHMPASIP
ncbi:MAG: sodium-dependent transporter [Longimicrobiales bacterium]